MTGKLLSATSLVAAPDAPVFIRNKSGELRVQAVSNSVLNRRSLAQQLVLLVLATMLPLILLALFTFYLLIENKRDSIRENLLVNAQTLAALVDNEIDKHAAIASTLAISPTLQNGDLAAFRREAERALEFAPGGWLTLSSPDGEILMSTFTPVGAAFGKRAIPEIMHRGFSERRFQVADLIFGPRSQRWTAFVEMPVFRDNAPLYSITITMPPTQFLALLTSRYTRGEVVGILDRDHKFVARIPDHDNRLSTVASEGWRAAIAGAPTGWTENQTLEGEWTLTGYARTQHGWTVGISQLETRLSESINKIAWPVGIAAGGMILVTLTLAGLIGRRASRGMTALAGAAQQLGEGQIVVAPPAPFSEAAAMGAMLAQVSRELNRRGEIMACHQNSLESVVAQRTSALLTEIQQREKIEIELRQTQKIESIGQLSAGVAHDFNNMLGVIMASLQLIQRRIKKGDTDVQRFIDTSLDSAERAAKLTQRLLAFARQQPLSPMPVDVNTLLAGMSDMLHRTISENIKIEMILAGELWHTHADVNQLENIVLNLTVNARDAMPDGGKFTVKTANRDLDESFSLADAEVTPGQYVMIAVTDTGIGMSADVLERAFEPFFTTKPTGQGTGLGLSQVHGFMKQSGGHVKITSEAGHGTTVSLYLPRFLGALDMRTESRGETYVSTVGGQQLVLVVEDEDNVRALTVENLRELGYQVLEADRAAVALRILDSNPAISLLFTDVIMPEGNGRILADQALLRRPDLKVLFTTGYSGDLLMDNGVLAPDVQVIFKPFKLDQLAAKVAAILST